MDPFYESAEVEVAIQLSLDIVNWYRLGLGLVVDSREGLEVASFGRQAAALAFLTPVSDQSRILL